MAMKFYWYKEFNEAKDDERISNRNRAFWWFLFLYFYSIIDAYMDSQMDEFPEEMKLDHPSDVAVDSEGDVYVVDWGNKRGQIFDSEGGILTCLYGDAIEFSKWASEVVQANPDALKAYRRVQDKSALAAFERPTSIAIDGNDRIIVSESTRGRLQVYVKEKDYMDPQYNL